MTALFSFPTSWKPSSESSELDCRASVIFVSPIGLLPLLVDFLYFFCGGCSCYILLWRNDQGGGIVFWAGRKGGQWVLRFGNKGKVGREMIILIPHRMGSWVEIVVESSELFTTVRKEGERPAFNPFFLGRWYPRSDGFNRVYSEGGGEKG